MICGMCGNDMIPIGTFTIKKAVIAYHCPKCDRAPDKRWHAV